MEMEVAAQPGGEGMTLAEGVDLIAELDRLARQREQLVLQVVTALAKVSRAGVVEAVEGLPIDTLLAVRHGWSRAEVAMMLDAGDVLAAMPATLTLWQQATLSWSVVRDIIAQVRRLGRHGRQTVDARLDASRELLVDMDPDRISWAVTQAVEEFLGLTAKERQEQAAARQSFLHLQLDVFGGARLAGYLNPLDAATVTNGLDHHANQQTNPQAEQPQSERPQGRRTRRRSRAQRRAQALVAIAAEQLNGRRTDGSTIPARPLMVVHVPLDRITTTASGLLEVAVPGSLPTLSATLTDTLSRDADIRAVLFDGARPLAVSHKIHAATVPSDTALAVRARDLGARDPAGRTPTPLSHIHHLTPGLHHPDRLVCLSPRGHLRTIHRHGWHGTIEPDGTVEWTRQDTTTRTRPWHTTLKPADPPPGRHRPQG